MSVYSRSLILFEWNKKNQTVLIAWRRPNFLPLQTFIFAGPSWSSLPPSYVLFHPLHLFSLYIYLPVNSGLAFLHIKSNAIRHTCIKQPPSIAPQHNKKNLPSLSIIRGKKLTLFFSYIYFTFDYSLSLSILSHFFSPSSAEFLQLFFQSGLYIFSPRLLSLSL